MTTSTRLQPSPSELAWAKFRQRVSELGGTVLEAAWLGATVPHRVRCSAGHEDVRRPHTLKGVICRMCAGVVAPAAADEAFRKAVSEMGGVVLEPKWLGANVRHRARCVAGHECTTLPASVRRGEGMCRTCARKDPKAAEAFFRATLAELGCTLLEPQWLGSRQPHRLLCPAGHLATPRPNDLQQGQRPCRLCIFDEWAVIAERKFRDGVAAQGGIVLEDQWLGYQVPHQLRCKRGHLTRVRPAAVHQGNGVCRYCRGLVWNVFYVVADDIQGYVKFGITSNNPQRRLGVHARDGFDRVVRLKTDLPGTVAPDLERSIIATLRLTGIAPARGFEYFPARATSTILRIVDNYPITPPGQQEASA